MGQSGNTRGWKECRCKCIEKFILSSLLHHLFFPFAWLKDDEIRNIEVLCITYKLHSLSTKPSIKIHIHVCTHNHNTHHPNVHAGRHTYRDANKGCLCQLSYRWEHLNGNGVGMRDQNVGWLLDQPAGSKRSWVKRKMPIPFKNRIISKKRKGSKGIRHT